MVTRGTWHLAEAVDQRDPHPDHAVILAEALTMAASNGRIEIVDHLLGVGEPTHSAPYRGITSLHLAIQIAKAAMVDHLVKLGASQTAIDDEWGATPSQWAEECADGSSSRQTTLTALSRPS